MSETARITVPKPKKRSQAADAVGRASGAGALFVAPHGLGLLIFTIVPIAIALVMSFYQWPVFGEKVFKGFGNYATLMQDPNFWVALGNTFVFVVTYVPINLAVSLGLAAWLTPKIRHRQFFRVLFFIPTVTPLVANVVVWRMIYQPNGMIDATMQSVFGVNAPNFLADPQWAMAAVVVMSVWSGFGYNMLLFSAALDSVPEHLMEAAVLDGANAWRTFLAVKLPLITPTLFFATIMTMITSFQVFVQPYVLTLGGPGNATTGLVQYMYQYGFRASQLGMASAAAWVLFVIIIGVTAMQFIGQRKWVHYE